MTEVSKHLGVHRATVYRWLDDGLPSHQPRGENGRRLFDLEEVDEWLRSRCSANDGDAA